MSDDPETGGHYEVPEGVPGNAACFIGHFPDRAVVPGAVLLGYAARRLATEGFEIASIKRMKFLRPLLPDQAFAIEFAPSRDGTVLTWTAGTSIVARARVKLRPHDR